MLAIGLFLLRAVVADTDDFTPVLAWALFGFVGLSWLIYVLTVMNQIAKRLNIPILLPIRNTQGNKND